MSIFNFHNFFEKKRREEFFPPLHRPGGIMMVPPSEREAGRSPVYYDPEVLERIGEDAVAGSHVALMLEQFPAKPDSDNREVI